MKRRKSTHMLTDQFKQRYGHKHKMTPLRLLLLLAIPVLIGLCALIFYYLPALPLFRFHTQAAAKPAISTQQQPGTVRTIAQHLLHPKTHHHITHELPLAQSTSSAMYLVTDCLDSHAARKTLTNILTRAQIAHQIETPKHRDQHCPRLLVGPMQHYSDLYRATYVLKAVDQPVTRMIRR